MSYFLGVDGGTESLRAFVFDETGRRLSTAAARYETAFSAGAQAEQDPEAWWRAIGIAVAEAVAAAGVSRSEIRAMCLATTCCSVVALDAQAAPLRPAIIWMDVRADAEAPAVLATGDPALRVNCDGAGPVSAEWMIPKALWIARNEPEVFERAETICEYQDFMNLRLTGRRCASLNNVSIRWHYSNRRGGLARPLVDKLGVSPLLEKWPSDVAGAGRGRSDR